MRKFLVLMAAISMAFACSNDTNEPKFHLVLAPIESYVLPDTLIADQSYDIKLTYRRLTTCYGFNNFYAQKDGNTRTIGIQNIVFENNDCQPLENVLIEKSFIFFAGYEEGSSSYIFRFYKGNGENGEALFETVEVPVVN